MTPNEEYEGWLEKRVELVRGLEIVKAGFPAIWGKDENETVAQYSAAIASVDAAIVSARANTHRT